MRAPGDAEPKIKAPRFAGLRGRLLLALALALAPVLAIVAFQASYSYREAVARSQDELLLSALNAGQRAKSTIEKGRTVLATLQSLRAVRGGGEPCREALQEVNASIAETANVVLLGPDGKVICSAQEVPEAFSAQGEPWFERARRGRALVLSPMAIGPFSSEPVLNLATPAPGVGVGRARGVLTLSIRIRAIDRGGAPRPLAPEISLADQTGQLLTGARAGGPKAIPVDWIKRAEGERGFVGFENRPDGRRGNVAVAPLVGEDIFVVLSTPTPTLVTWTRLDLLGRVVLPIAMFLLALATVWWGGDRLVLRWVRDLRGLANSYAQGDYAAKPPEDSRAPEELKALSRALTDMAGRIDVRDQTLKDALEEKQTLLREVHHRVKNNLQIMVSLFNMQLRTLGDDEGRRALEEARARVTALALVHQALYEGEDLRTVDLGEFIEGMVRALIDAAGGAARRVDLSVQVAAPPVPASIAVPLALYVVEAVTNALKHAFPEDRDGVIDIQVVEHDQMMRVTISDDGVGIDPKRPAERTGVSLMNAFARQLRGQSCIGPAPNGGARVELSFPLTEPLEEP
jgi:two-component sensor histidine kinase